MTNDRRITAVLTSYNWPQNAEVLVTECGHRHVRPKGYYRHGDALACPFCEEREQFPVDPSAPVLSDDDE